MLVDGSTGGSGTEHPISTVVRLKARRLSGTQRSGDGGRRARRLRPDAAPPEPAASIVAEERPRPGTVSSATVVGESALAVGEAVEPGEDSVLTDPFSEALASSVLLAS